VIAVDSSSWIAYLSGETAADTAAVEEALTQRQACLPPVVLTELLSDCGLPSTLTGLLRQLPPPRRGEQTGGQQQQPEAERNYRGVRGDPGKADTLVSP
jgi:hypothetical protein